MNPVIRFENVTKRFGRQPALDQLSLEIPPGVVFALLGENGAGKTTAIRILLGLVEPDHGRAEALALDSRKQGLEIRRRVGYVAERPVFYEWMTVDEIGWFTSGFYPEGFLTRYRQYTSEFMLPRDRKLKALSKGMRAKVVLALAMAHEPELLVLDEPTSGLDTLVRREFLESMVEWAASGRTVLLSSHQIGEVERVADMVAIMHQGRLLVVEPLDRLKEEVREVTLALADGLAPPDVEGEVLRQRQKGRQWQILVRRLAEGQVPRWREDASILSIDVRAPSLEEIFVAYMEQPVGLGSATS